MNRIAAFLGGTFAAAGLNIVSFAHEGHEHGGPVTTTTVQGELVDTACYVSSKGEEKGADHASCARKCMKSGIPAGILPQGFKGPQDVLYLLTNPIPLAPYAGQTVKVEGTTHSESRAIDVQKVYVKQGGQWKEVQLNDAHHKAGSGAAAEGEHEDHHDHVADHDHK
jgi:hypothetical protein